VNGTLLIHTEDGGVRWRMQIESNNVSHLGFKVRIVANHVMAQPMRLETITSPDPDRCFQALTNELALDF
jgi:hypothetical protein